MKLSAPPKKRVLFFTGSFQVKHVKTSMHCGVAVPSSLLGNDLGWQQAPFARSKVRKYWFVLMFHLSFMSIPAVVWAEGQVINIDSKYNTYYNPQSIYLPAGNYALEYIGPLQGGRHTARNAWRGIAIWCNQLELCELGWQMSVVIDGDSLNVPPKYTYKHWGGGELFLCRPANFMATKPSNFRHLAFASPEGALETMRNAQDAEGFCSFQLERSGFIRLFDGDRNSSDNHGGVSVRIWTSLPRQDFLLDILPGTHSNVIDASVAGILEVVILGGDGRDVSTIRPETLSLLPDASPLNVQPSPVCMQTTSNDDQHPDLACQFVRDPSEVGPGATGVYLRGLTTDGKMIQGRDVVTLRAASKQ